MSTDGWRVEPRPVPEALTDTFPRKDYEEPEQRFNGHIRDWASFTELAGAEGMALLAKAVL